MEDFYATQQEVHHLTSNMKFRTEVLKLWTTMQRFGLKRKKYHTD